MDPVTGQPIPGMPAGDVSTPFIFDMMDMIPGISTATGINMGRYANTLMEGGFNDYATSGIRKAGFFRKRTAAKMGSFVGDAAASAPGDSKMFMFGKRRTLSAEKTPFLRQSVRNNFNPRATRRLSSVSALTGDPATGYYTPFQGISSMMKMAAFDKAGKPRDFFAKKFGLKEGDVAYSGGVLGRAMSMGKIYNLQRQAAAGSTRAAAKLAKASSNINKVISVNPNAINAIGQAAAQTSRQTILSSGVTMSDDLLAATTREAARAATTPAAIAAQVADDPLRAVSSSMTTGVVSNRITKYIAGTLNPALMTEAQLTAVRQVGVARGGQQFVDNFIREFGPKGGKRIFKGGREMMKMGRTYVAEGGEKVFGRQLAKMGATRMGLAVMPGINMLMYGQLMYDITKGLGKIAARGVNFAKDALKSMQGTINKPMFGTGFVDNEIAASSRARGVMAIQNSRLNARSLLGSEAAQMAAHFG